MLFFKKANVYTFIFKDTDSFFTMIIIIKKAHFIGNIWRIIDKLGINMNDTGNCFITS